MVAKHGEHPLNLEADANADLIATAVNCHDDLLRACQIAYACLRHPNAERDENRVVNVLLAAIAKAEKPSP